MSPADQWDRLTAAYRMPDRAAYPELAGLSRRQIYNDCFGGGALYLAARMARTLCLRPGQIVLDLGCGKAGASMFLAERYGVRVIAADRRDSLAKLSEKLDARGLRERVVPMRLDGGQKLPFARDYFDAIFCMNSLSFFGGTVEVLRNRLGYVRPVGLLCVGSECLSDEFTPVQLADPPAVYNYCLPGVNINVWEGDFSRQHSRARRRDLFERTGMADVRDCYELEDATVLYEDLVLYQIEYDVDPDDVERSIRQLEFAQTLRPRKSLYVLAAQRT